MKKDTITLPYVTTDWNEAQRICEPFSRLRLPKEIEELLDSGKALYYFKGNPPGWTCWPHFPFNRTKEENQFMKKHKYYVEKNLPKEIEANGFSVSKTVKVIIEVGLFYGSEAIEKDMLDCFAHTILYLENPFARNECEDTDVILNKYGIFYVLPNDVEWGSVRKLNGDVFYRTKASDKITDWYQKNSVKLTNLALPKHNNL